MLFLSPAFGCQPAHHHHGERTQYCHTRQDDLPYGWHGRRYFPRCRGRILDRRLILCTGISGGAFFLLGGRLLRARILPRRERRVGRREQFGRRLCSRGFLHGGLSCLGGLCREHFRSASAHAKGRGLGSHLRDQVVHAHRKEEQETWQRGHQAEGRVCTWAWRVLAHHFWS